MKRTNEKLPVKPFQYDPADLRKIGAIYFRGRVHLLHCKGGGIPITAYTEFLNAALAVARLNFDQPDSIRPRTNGATDAFHRLEDAAMPFLAAEEQIQPCGNCGVYRSVIGSHIAKCTNCGDDEIYLGREYGT